MLHLLKFGEMCRLYHRSSRHLVRMLILAAHCSLASAHTPAQGLCSHALKPSQAESIHAAPAQS